MRRHYERVDSSPTASNGCCSLFVGEESQTDTPYGLSPDSKTATRIGVLLLLPQLLIIIGLTIGWVIVRQQRGTTLLYGDSLVVGAPALFTPVSLVERMRMDSVFSRTIYANGKGGATISDLIEYLDFVLEFYRPQHMIMLWDTDAGIRYAEYTPDGLDEYLNNYNEQVRYACARVIESGANLAISGPVLMPSRGDPNTSFTLDLFRELNQNVSNDMNITYIDLRKAFLENGGEALTLDGEHFNFYGNALASKIFLQLVNIWSR